MGMKVKDIFKISIFRGTVVLGGEKGLENEIEWFNLMEIVDSIASLSPGEFLISTGFGFDDEKISKGLIGMLKERGLSGIGIQTGYYIKEVPNHLIEEGNALDFPVLWIPPKITFSHITKALYKELMEYKKEEAEPIDPTDTFKCILTDFIENKKVSYQQEKYIQEYCKIDEYSCTYLWVIKVTHRYDGIVLRSDINDCLKQLGETVGNQDGKYHTEIYQDIHLMLVNCPLATRDSLYKQVKLVLQKMYLNNINLRFLLGYSTKITNKEMVREGLREALSAAQSLANIDAKKGVLSYNNIDALKPLQNKEVKDSMIIYANTILMPITKNDNDKNTKYYETLKAYIEHNFNQSETAKELSIHRHTLSNRIEGIKRLLEIDYIDSISYLKYHLAIEIYEMYR